MKFNCHMNVLFCSTVKSVKYIFKYIHKGNDCAHVETKENTLHHDEILQYLDARYVGPHQAMFRIMQYKMHNKSHFIIRLAVHLLLQQNIYFQEGNEERVLNVNPNTTLTAWFQLNQVNEDAHQYLNIDIPVHYNLIKEQKYGGKGDAKQHPPLEECTKFSLQIHKDMPLDCCCFIIAGSHL